jgi:hypothetical protein
MENMKDMLICITLLKFLLCKIEEQVKVYIRQEQEVKDNGGAEIKEK